MNDHNQNIKEANLHDRIISKDGTLKFDFMTSLKNIVIAKIVYTLWMDRNILEQITEFLSKGIDPWVRKESNAWKEIENSIIAKVLQLVLPKSLGKILTNVVPVIGNSILNWIEYHDIHILNTDEKSKYSAVDQISNVIWTVRGKIDYAETAKNILANVDTCLSNDHKYKIACEYCLQDEKAVLAVDVVDPCYLDNIDIDMHPMVYYWTARITGSCTKLYNPSYNNRYYRRDNNISINEEIFQLLICNNGDVDRTFNEVPISYMWNNLTKEEKAKNIVPFVKELYKQELIYSLLSNISYEQQQEVFKDCSDTILHSHFNDWLWGEYFLPTTFHVMNIMDQFCYLRTLSEIVDIKTNYQARNNYLYDQCKSFVNLLWQRSPSPLKDFICKHKDMNLLEELVMVLSLERDVDILKLIFDDLTIQQRRDIIVGYSIFDHCYNYIENDQCDLLELFIRSILSSEEDVKWFKKVLRTNKIHETAEKILDIEELDKIERFLGWACESKEEIDEAKLDILSFKLNSTEKSIIANNKVDLTEFENVVQWCVDPKEVNGFKYDILEVIFDDWIVQFIQEDKYELSDQILNWFFADNKIKLSHFKNNMYKDDFFGSSIKQLTVLLIERTNSLTTLDKFIDWSFTNGQVQEFKTWLLNPFKTCKFNPLKKNSVCTDFLVENQFELADKIIKWCVTTYKDIAKFKKMLMLSDDMNFMFGFYFEKEKPDLFLLIKWFKPSEELIKDFKNRFPKEKCPNNFHELLDDFLQNHNNL